MLTESCHLSGHLHVTGRSKFVGDEPKPSNLLFIQVVPSTQAHAKIISIDIDKARGYPGVEAVYTWRDIPGENQIGSILPDEPLLPEDIVSYVGQPVAIVVAKNEKIAKRAAALVKIDYELLPPLFSIEEALEKQSFFAPPQKIERGDIHQGFESSDHVLEGVIHTGAQEHYYFETQRTISVPDEDNNLTVYSSTQSTLETQETVARVLGIKNKDVVVDVRRLGGAFGGKERNSVIWACLASLAAYRLKKPTELKLSRKQDMSWTGKRHPFRGNYRIGFNRDGKIIAYDIHLASNGGATVDLSLAITERAMLHAENAYFIPNIRIEGVACRTHLPPNTAFRGFGAPQGILMIESAIERMANFLKMDPLHIRAINSYQAGQTTPYEQPVEEPCYPVLLDQLKKNAAYQSLVEDTEQFNQSSTTAKRGIGVVLIKFGVAFVQTHLNQASSLIWIYPDGTLSVSHGGVEMGQEVNTKVAHVVARTLGVPLSNIRVESANTRRAGNASPTAASTGSDINGQAALQAALTLKARLAEVASELMQEKYQVSVDKTQLTFEGGSVYDPKVAAQKLSFEAVALASYRRRVDLGAHGFYRMPLVHFDRERGRGYPYSYFVYGAALVQAEVDILTGQHRLLKVFIVHETAKSLNRAIDEGQIAGAFFQGYGYCTMEELTHDEEGRYLEVSPSTYKIPTIRNLPEVFHIDMIERDCLKSSVYGSKAIGEPPIIYGEAAYFAIKRAIEATDNGKIEAALNFPATPEAVLESITQRSIPSILHMHLVESNFAPTKTNHENPND